MDEIHAKGSTILGMQAWAERGIVGRGVLIDYFSWAQKNHPYNPLTTYSISLSGLKKVITEENLEIQSGDILFVRSGMIHEYTKLSLEQKEAIAAANPPHFAGLEQSEEMLEWIWNSQFAAVAGDATAFEAWRKQSTKANG